MHGKGSIACLPGPDRPELATALGQLNSTSQTLARGAQRLHALLHLTTFLPVASLCHLPLSPFSTSLHRRCNMAPSSLCLDLLPRLLVLQRRGGLQVKPVIPRNSASADSTDNTLTAPHISAGAIAAVATGGVLVVGVVCWLLW